MYSTGKYPAIIMSSVIYVDTASYAHRLNIVRYAMRNRINSGLA